VLRRRAGYRHDHPKSLRPAASSASEPEGRAVTRAKGSRAGAAGSPPGSADGYLWGQDPVLRRLIDEAGPIDPATDRRGSRPDPYEAIARAIVGQQLSTKAAASIWGKLRDTFDGRTPAPGEILEADEQTLRGAGLSRSKVGFLRDLASRVTSGELDLARLPELSDEDVIAALIEVHGVGRWTAEMFLIFHLGRPDVVSTGDLGIRRAVQIAYDLDELPAPAELERIAEPWRPHRTLACLYLWRSLAATPA
jgi:DNA-3-methyladenine glycosylase II